MPRFVIQQHEQIGRITHWDLMLEMGSSLRTFRLASIPENDVPIEAILIRDHPLRFLEYQGPVNQGQGQVRIVDKGTYQILEMSQGRWSFQADGPLLNGGYELTHLAGQQWILVRTV